MFGRSPDDDDGPEVEISQEELELARRLTSSSKPDKKAIRWNVMIRCE